MVLLSNGGFHRSNPGPRLIHMQMTTAIAGKTQQQQQPCHPQSLPRLLFRLLSPTGFYLHETSALG
jgi:hypothetical protein